ncbi:hypothetical protein GCM10010361_72840 [Streptomyces olivaceiscleroticus]|uniref:Uncharacterized protein n=1 Tax=Streptomyces olivaceiscleroticus TaxID=68245 RepID=A0ABN1BFG9_9ACTN
MLGKGAETKFDGGHCHPPRYAGVLGRGPDASPGTPHCFLPPRTRHGAPDSCQSVAETASSTEV